MLKLLNYIFAYIVVSIKGVKVLFPARIEKSTFKRPNYIGRHCVLVGTSVGRYSYLGNDCEFYYSRIGSFCSFANDVKLIRGQHPTKTYVSTSPIFYQSITCFGKGFVKKTIFKLNKKCADGSLCSIGNDVWIGSHVRIMEGVHIGNGAIIGAGAIVTKDVPPYSIVCGVPAKIIRYRFLEEEIQKLENSEWWNWSEEKIRQYSPYFSDIACFIDKLKYCENFCNNTNL